MEVQITQLRFGFDSIVLFNQEPIPIKNDHGEEIKIWGICMNQEENHADDLTILKLNRYISYIQSCRLTQEKSGEIGKNLLIFPSGNKVSLNNGLKNFIYRIIRDTDQLPSYKIIETEILDIHEGEIDGNFLISPEPLKRMGIEYPRPLTKSEIMKEKQDGREDEK